MMDLRIAKYQWGQQIRTLSDLYNDGSYPDRPVDALLVQEGDRGEIVQVGTHVESGVPVYMVEFGGGNVVGCLEEEITAA